MASVARRSRPDVVAPRPRRAPKPVEYNILLTATLCLLAAGAVMVYSASSARTLLEGQGDGTVYLVKYLAFGALGLVVLQLLAHGGLERLPQITPALLALSFVLLVAVKVPGIGVEVNGARRWIGAGPLQFQPSELCKLALVLYATGLLATTPSRLRTLKGGAIGPLLVVTGGAILLVASQPDLGTALVIAFSIGALLLVAGVPLALLGKIAGVGVVLVLLFIVVEPYRAARLTAFVNPWAHASGSGFQAVQGQIALGSGGMFGVGLGESVQKVFYLPEAHTDFILAVIGEELGVAGICGLLFLYGLIGYAGLRTAKAARTRYTQLLAAGLTSLIVCQALLNVFAVLGIAPLTGVPLPFISSGSSSLLVLLATMGLLLNVASRSSSHLASLPVPDAPPGEDARGSADAAGADRSRRNGRARRARAGGRRSAAGGRG
jgi:cell division protein FtsW